jgi:hypothetical protein
MIPILIALISITAIAGYCATKDAWCSFFHEIVCPVFVLVGFLGLLFYCILAFHYISAGYKKDIINREYKTNYTQKEVFYASDVIETVRELNRSRVEINGDLLKTNN